MQPKLSNDRALRIVAAAREEFAKRGFAGARVNQIATRAGVNKQLMFYYYHSKRGLFQAVLAHCATELDCALASLTPPSGAGGRPLDTLRLKLVAPFDLLAGILARISLAPQRSPHALPFCAFTTRVV